MMTTLRSAATIIATTVAVLLAGCSAHVSAPLVAVEGAPPDSVVARTLERSLTMASSLHLYPWSARQWSANLNLMDELQPTLVGRAALVWGWENLMLRSLGRVSHRVAQIHERVPGAVVQGCIFEFVSRDVEKVTVPADVLAAFDLEPSPRPYDFEAMLPTSQEPDWFPGWEQTAVVPDITRRETQLWFFHLAKLYLDAGLEAIHLGNLERMARQDPDFVDTEALLTRMRQYAATNGRRGWVILDAHTHGIVRDRRLLLDFHSFPLRPREVGPRDLADVVLERDHQDAIYGRSRGGVTPSGTYTRHQRFLVELDNGYAGPSAGGCDLPECVWGSDEITWFANQPSDRRDELLAYFWRRVPELDSAGRFQMPGIRPLQARLASGCERFLLHDPSALSCGSGQAAIVAELWGVAP